MDDKIADDLAAALRLYAANKICSAEWRYSEAQHALAAYEAARPKPDVFTVFKNGKLIATITQQSVGDTECWLLGEPPGHLGITSAGLARAVKIAIDQATQ